MNETVWCDCGERCHEDARHLRAQLDTRDRQVAQWMERAQAAEAARDEAVKRAEAAEERAVNRANAVCRMEDEANAALASLNQAVGLIRTLADSLYSTVDGEWGPYSEETWNEKYPEISAARAFLAAHPAR